MRKSDRPPAPELPAVAVLLGAGASRGVSYAHEGEYPSPLDGDFFDLLRRLDPSKRDKPAVKFVLSQLDSLPYNYRRSMERVFYTLHLRAYMERKLARPIENDKSPEETIVASFARCIQALLRKSHGKNACENHVQLLQGLGAHDTVVSFNYDLVIERALMPIAKQRHIPYGRWLYGFAEQEKAFDLPLILKLHGSSNWRLPRKEFVVLTNDWSDFRHAPGYLGHRGHGTTFPIFLPFWDKRIENHPWLQLWQHAMTRLRRASSFVVWGYSLPQTDVKAQQLFQLALGGGRRLQLCIVDPSVAARERWREMFPNAQYWEYNYIGEFLHHPPRWWR